MPLQDLFTGKDNTTHDLGRWSWIGSFLSVVGSVAWNALHGTMIDIVSLAQALAAVTVAHGAALWAKKDTEPQASSEPDVKP